jgi:hypothetical protein
MMSERMLLVVGVWGFTLRLSLRQALNLALRLAFLVSDAGMVGGDGTIV